MIDRYFTLLKAHASDPHEKHLTAASELGRELVLSDTPPEELGKLHHQALQHLAGEFPKLTLAEASLRTSQPLMEMLMAYGLAFREQLIESKEAEEAIRRSETRYRSLIEHAQHGIYRSSMDDEFLTVNPALVEMLGYESEAELTAVKPNSLYESPEQRAQLIQQYEDAERIEGVEVPWKCKDGTAITVRLSGRRVDSHGEGPAGFEMMVENVTERRTLEAQLRQAQKMEAIGDLTGGIAHDFNNILTVIMSNAELVGDSLPPDATEERADLEEMRCAAARGSAMIKKLMGFSRREKLTLQSVKLGQLVADMTRMFLS